MKKVLAVFMACGVMAAAGVMAETSSFDEIMQNAQSEVTVGVDLASSYITDSSTYNNGLVLQPYLDITGLPVEFGVWANYDIDDYDGNVSGNEFSEVDLIARIPYSMGPVDAALSYVAWTYPTTSAAADQLVELDLSGSLMDTITVGTLGRYYFAGASERSWYIRPYAGYDYSITEDLTASLTAEASYINRHEGEDGMLGYDFGVGLAYKYVYASCKYYGRFDEDVLPDGTFAYDKEWLFSIGTSITY